MPKGKKIVHPTLDPADINKDVRSIWPRSAMPA